MKRLGYDLGRVLIVDDHPSQGPAALWQTPCMSPPFKGATPGTGPCPVLASYLASFAGRAGRPASWRSGGWWGRGDMKEFEDSRCRH